MDGVRDKSGYGVGRWSVSVMKSTRSSGPNTQEFLLPQAVMTMGFPGCSQKGKYTVSLHFFSPKSLVSQPSKVFQVVKTTCISPLQISLTLLCFLLLCRPLGKVQVNILPASLTVLFVLMAFKLTGGQSWLSQGLKCVVWEVSGAELWSSSQPNPLTHNPISSHIQQHALPWSKSSLD